MCNKFEDYKELNKIKKFYLSPFEYNGAQWNSVEHAFQSEKIKLVDPEKAKWFKLISQTKYYHPHVCKQRIIIKKLKILILLH